MILITGAIDLIGTDGVQDWLDRRDEPIVNYGRLADAGAVITSTRSQHGSRNIASYSSRHIFVQGDIGDTEHMTRLLMRLKPKVILSFAAQDQADDLTLGLAGVTSSGANDTSNLLETVRTYWVNLPETEKNEFCFLQIPTEGVCDALRGGSDPTTELHKQPIWPFPLFAGKNESRSVVRS